MATTCQGYAWQDEECTADHGWCSVEGVAIDEDGICVRETDDCWVCTYACQGDEDCPSGRACDGDACAVTACG